MTTNGKPVRPQMPKEGLEAMKNLMGVAARKAVEEFIPDTDWLFEAIQDGVKEAFREYLDDNPTMVAEMIAAGVEKANVRR